MKHDSLCHFAGNVISSALEGTIASAQPVPREAASLIPMPWFNGRRFVKSYNIKCVCDTSKKTGFV